MYLCFGFQLVRLFPRFSCIELYDNMLLCNFQAVLFILARDFTCLSVAQMEVLTLIIYQRNFHDSRICRCNAHFFNLYEDLNGLFKI
jgi:hypothetical protein